MAASIRFNGTPGPLQITAGVVALSNANDTGVLGWDWELLDRPRGSAAVVTSEFAAAPNFTADVAGSYRVRLRTYLDVGRTLLDATATQITYILTAVPYAWRKPAAGETTEVDATRGWAEAVEEIIDAVRGRFIKNNFTAVARPTTADNEAAGYSAGSVWIFQELNPSNYIWIAAGEDAGDMVWVPVAVKSNFNAGAPPAITDDSASGYEVSSLWALNADGGMQMWICANASVGDATWIRIAEPGTGTSSITALIGSDGASEDFARADHAHAHAAQTDDTLHAVAVDDTSAGFMSGAQSAALTKLLLRVPSDTVCAGFDDFEDARLAGWRVRYHGPSSQVQHVPNISAADLLPGSGCVFLNVGTDANDNVTILNPGIGLVLDDSVPLIHEWRLCPAASGVYTDDQFAWIAGLISTPFAEDSTPDALIAFYAQWAGAARNWRFALWGGGAEISGADVTLPALGAGEKAYRIRITATSEYATLEYAIDAGALTVLRTLGYTRGGVAWTRVTTTATVTYVGHGLATNDTINVSASSSLAAITNGPKVITVTGPDTFTFTCLDAGAASGTLTYSNAPGAAVYSPIAWSENTGGPTGDRTLAIDYFAYSGKRATTAANAGTPAAYNTSIFPFGALRTRATGSTTPSLSNEDDDMLEVDTTAGNVTIQLPDPAGRRIFRVKKTNAGANTITLGRYGGENIENVGANYALPNSALTTFPSWCFYSNGTNWYKVQ